MNLGILLLGVAAIAQNGGPGDPAPAPFTSKDGGFSIAMPGTPTISFQQKETPAGTIINKIFQVIGEDKVNSVICTDYPGEINGDQEAFLNGVLQGLSQSTGGQLLTQKNIQVEGCPGRQVMLKLPLGLLHSRYFLKGKRIYQIVQLQMKGKDAPEEFDQYAASFRTSEPVGKLTDGMDGLSNWGEFRPKGGGFRLKMIGNPKEQLQKIPSPAGVVDVHLFHGINLKGETFGFSYHDVPKAVPIPTPENFYTQALAGSVANLKGKLVRRKAIEYEGQPAIEAEVALPGKMAFPDPTYVVRMYWLKDRMYQLIYVGPKASVESKEVVDFLGSFQLDGPGDPPREKGSTPRKKTAF